MKQILETHGQRWSERAIGQRLGLARNTVHKFLTDPAGPNAQAEAEMRLKLEPYLPYLRERLGDGLQNAVVLLRELRARGYTGGYTMLTDYLRPLRRRRSSTATMRYEAEPGAQAQVDFGLFRHTVPSGGVDRLR